MIADEAIKNIFINNKDKTSDEINDVLIKSDTKMVECII